MCPDCNTKFMELLSPMHPHTYLNLACDRHRAEFMAENPAFADYVPEDWRVSGLSESKD